jgi:asparagine synthase (glutamine-hydrolysing)
VPATPQQFPGRFCDERTHAASVARMYPNIDHVLIPTGAHSMFQVADLLATGGRAPVRNLSHCAWLYEICRQAKLKRADTILAASFGNLTISYDGAPALASSLASGRFAVAARLARDLHKHSGASWKSVLNRAVQPFLPLPVAGMIARIRSGNAPASPASFLRPEFARAYDVDAAATARPTHTRDSRLLRARFLYRFDTGIPSEAFWQATGVRRTDPTFDPRVVEFCLSVPLERFCEGGVGRSLIRDAMKGKISEMVRTETRRGLQSADFLVNLRAEMPELRRELMRARSSSLVSRALNLPLMDEMGGWSEDRIRNFGWTVYASTMMRAVSAARFLRRMEDGTLFVMPPAPGGMPEASAA